MATAIFGEYSLSSSHSRDLFLKFKEKLFELRSIFPSDVFAFLYINYLYLGFFMFGANTFLFYVNGEPSAFVKSKTCFFDSSFTVCGGVFLSNLLRLKDSKSFWC